ncbi:substrate-binding periplasmic protein [Bdellovibrio sp. HCB337]|uniref:substrate-binding periplasmic protein n=1 Tax=Bdellovibrio sp. HCB337 TaxID=3394358 RepID=UPI0039A7672C
MFLSSLLFLLPLSASAKPFVIATLDMPPHVALKVEAPKPEGAIPNFVEQYLAAPLKAQHGLIIEWHQAPLARAIKAVETGEADMLFFISKNPEREKVFVFSSEPFFTDTAALLVKKDSTPLDEVKNIALYKNKTIGMTEGVATPEIVKKNNIQILLVPGNAYIENSLDLVAQNRMDAFLSPLSSVGEYIVHTSKREVKLKSLKIAGSERDYYVIFSKKLAPKVRETINTLLQKHRAEYPKLIKY